MKTIVIAAYVRTPFHFAKKGLLAKVRPDDLAAVAVKGLVARAGLDVELYEDLIMGCAFPEAEQGYNIARLVGLLAGLPLTLPGQTINRFCGSSMQAIHSAAGALQYDDRKAFLCAGVESMSRIPMTGYNPMPNPGLYKSRPGVYMGMGDTAEVLAGKFKVSRADQERFSVNSHAKAAAARTEGRLSAEIVPVGAVTEDGCIRPDTTAEALAALKPVFDVNGVVTAGTASPLTDGASATLVCSEDFAAKHGLSPLARIKSFAVSGCEPEIMGIGPIQSTRMALERAGLTVDDLDVIELNEAFAVQALVCIRELGLNESKVNLDGGAIALGHPLGATGARITGKAAQLLQRTKGRYALATQCIGGGQGIATVLEAV